MPSGVRAALAALIAVASCAGSAAGQAWPIKQFQVRPVEPEGLTGTRGAGAFVRAARALGIDPDDVETVTLPQAKIDALEAHLRGAAELLEGWGFPPPALEPVVETESGPAYRIYVMPVLDNNVAGEYHGPICTSADESVAILSYGALTDSLADLPLSGLQTAAHELFHAVQYATPFFEDGACGESVGHWITEGQARAVAWDITRRLQDVGTGSVDGEVLWGARSYSHALAVPRRGTGRFGRDPAYQTASLWRYLAEYQAAGGPPGPDVNPVDYRYLSRLLRTPRTARDCTTPLSECDAELRWLDAGVRVSFGRGLRDLFPRFMDAFALYGSRRYTAIEGGDARENGRIWRGTGFDRLCADIDLRNRTDSLQARFEVDEFEIVAAQCWEVALEGFDEPVPFSVTVERPRPDELAQLSALTAGGSERVDTAEVQFRGDGVRPFTTWVFDPDPERDRTIVLLTNVAHDPAATVPIIGTTPVTFTALESLASMATESVGSGSGPSGSDVDRPLPIELDELGALIAPDPTPQARRALDDPCTLRIDMENTDRGDALQLALTEEGPIGPGTYRLSRASPMDIHPQNSPGEFKLNFGISESNPMSAGQAQGFFGEGGTVEIESVKAGLVRGRLVATGWRNRYDGPSRYEKPYGLESVAIEVRFAVVARNAVGEPGSRCLAG